MLVGSNNHELGYTVRVGQSVGVRKVRASESGVKADVQKSVAPVQLTAPGSNDRISQLMNHETAHTGHEEDTDCLISQLIPRTRGMRLMKSVNFRCR